MLSLSWCTTYQSFIGVVFSRSVLSWFACATWLSPGMVRQKSVHCAPFGMVGPVGDGAAPDVESCGAAVASLPDLFDAQPAVTSAAASRTRMNGRQGFFIGRYLTQDGGERKRRGTTPVSRETGRRF